MLIENNMLMLFYLIEKQIEIQVMFNKLMIEFLLFIFIKKKIIKKKVLKCYKVIELKIQILYYKII